MSYILDALRKSEAERRQVETPVLSPGTVDVVEVPRRSIAAWAGIAAVLVVAVGATLYWLYGTRGEPDRAGARSASVAAAPPAPVTSTAAAKPPAPSRPETEARKPADAPPELKRHPLATAPEPPVRDLAGETRVEAAKPKRAPSSTASRDAGSGQANVATATAPTREQVVVLRSMPLDFQRALPELVVNIHIYARHEAERILYINNRQYHAGERVRADIVVEDIVEDGAVLSYRGQRFKLPRPS
jgi:general secretion pathway protein B